jgi:hypothetical protein
MEVAHMIPEQQKHCQCGWQSVFLTMLPELNHRLRYAFHSLDPESRDDAIEDGIVHCLLAYVRLFNKGREKSIRPSSLAWYATLQVRAGRQAGCQLNVKDPLSRYAQLKKGISVERLDVYSVNNEEWIESLAQDKRASVPDQVAARMDFRAWLSTLSERTSEIAKDLAFGFTTAEVSKRYGVTAGRISQMRRTLATSWSEYQRLLV